MEGFDAKQFDDLLNLIDKGLPGKVMLSVGYREEENDFYARIIFLLFLLHSLQLPTYNFGISKPA